MRGSDASRFVTREIRLRSDRVFKLALDGSSYQSHLILGLSACPLVDPLFVSCVPFTFIDFADPVIGTNHCLPKAAWSGRCGSPSAGRIRVTRQQVRGIFNGMRLARISPAQRCSVNLNDGNCSFIELHYLSRLRDALGSPPVSSFDNVEKADEMINLTSPPPHAHPRRVILPASRSQASQQISPAGRRAYVALS